MFNKKKKYILDGGSGQTLIEKGLKPDGTLWSATALINKNLHHLVIDTHIDFIKAGSDMIVTSNFSVRKKRLIEHKKLDFFESATKDAGELANKAKELSGKNVIIAGSLPTQGIVYFSELTSNDKEIYQGFFETAKILNPYVDLFYLDVLSSVKEIKIASDAIKIFNKPILIGVHLNKNALLPSGEEILEIIPEIKNINCCGIIVACVSPEIVGLALPQLSKQDLPYGFKVNAFKDIPEDIDNIYEKQYDGNPTKIFGTRKNEFTPAVFYKFVNNATNFGATLLGGCCEIKPRHIQTLKKIM